MPTPSRTPAPRHPFLTWLNRPEQLARTLVGRDHLMRSLLQGIAATTQGGPANHVLLVGPRGIGKTHVLSLLDHYAAGRLQPPEEFRQALAAWVPVFFSEEEFAGQNSLANFLLTALRKLGEANSQEGLWKLPTDLPARGDIAVTECCFERMRRFHAERGKRLLLLVDHIQRILQQWPSDDHDSLRAFLSGQGFILVIGTAPSVFREVLSQRAAFHQFFDIQILQDLSEGDTLEFLRRLYCEDGREADFDARRGELSRKLPAVLTLTGGNPRLILFLYQVATRSTFLEIETALSELLDGLHDYFLQRFERLADQPRKVLDTIAQMPGPATPTEIAQAARLTPALVNAQLRRLKTDHYVQVVKFKRQKSTRYDITERLFRIWRQTATVAGRRRFRFLTDFLKLYFTPEEVRSLYLQHVAALDGKVGTDHEAVSRLVDQLYYIQAAAEGETRREVFGTRMLYALRIGAARQAEEIADELVSESLANGDRASVLTARSAMADMHISSGNYADALSDTEALIRLLGWPEAKPRCETLVERVPESAEAWFQLALVSAYLREYDRTLGACRRAVEVGPPTAPLRLLEAVALARLGRTKEAVSSAAEGLCLVSTPEEEMERAIGVLPTFLDADEVLEALNRVLRRRPTSASAHEMKAIALDALGRTNEAMASLSVAGEHGTPTAVSAWLRGNFLLSAGRYHEAVRSCNEAADAKAEFWAASVNRDLALACLGRYGPGMEALPAAFARAAVPEASWADVSKRCRWTAQEALGRGETVVCLGLLNAFTSIPRWRVTEWFPQHTGTFLLRVIEIRPQEFLAAMEIVRRNVTEEDVLRLLDPFIQAAEFIRTRDLTLLERLFPEVRELVLDIVHRVAPELDELVKPAR